MEAELVTGSAVLLVGEALATASVLLALAYTLTMQRRPDLPPQWAGKLVPRKKYHMTIRYPEPTQRRLQVKGSPSLQMPHITDQFQKRKA